MWFYRYLLMFYSKLCNDFSNHYLHITHLTEEPFFFLIILLFICNSSCNIF